MCKILCSLSEDFDLTVTSYSVIGYSDAMSKGTQQIDALRSVRGVR